MLEEPLLRHAWTLYKQGRFTAVLESLEPKIFQHRENPVFFRILGLAALRQGDWKGGETYLQRSVQLDDTPHRDTLLGLMAVTARRKDYGEAVSLGLQLLDLDASDRIAKKALARLRLAVAAPDGPSIDRDTVGSWLPSFRKTNPEVRRWIVRIVSVLAIMAGLVGGAWWGLQWVSAPAPATARSGPETGAGFPSGEVVQGGAFAVTLSPEEVRQGWARAQTAFQNYMDSRARFEINRLLLSNASPLVKERARALIPFLHEPDFARPDDTSSYQEVRVSPPLYEGCTVRWTGVIANLSLGTKKITFDLLLGYENGQVVEGIVPVELGFAALLKNSQVVEVLGRVVLRDGQWFVQGTSLREQGFRAP